MTERTFCLTKEEFIKAHAELRLATRMGFIADFGISSLKQRCEEKNKENKKAIEAGEAVYGCVEFSYASYLQHELTTFRLDFACKNKEIADKHYEVSFSEKERIKFYNDNLDLFKRAEGDLFTFEEVETIVEKKMREEAYEQFVQNILCEL